MRFSDDVLPKERYFAYQGRVSRHVHEKRSAKNRQRSVKNDFNYYKCMPKRPANNQRREESKNIAHKVPPPQMFLIIRGL